MRRLLGAAVVRLLGAAVVMTSGRVPLMSTRLWRLMLLSGLSFTMI